MKRETEPSDFSALDQQSPFDLHATMHQTTQRCQEREEEKQLFLLLVTFVFVVVMFPGFLLVSAEQRND